MAPTRLTTRQQSILDTIRSRGPLSSSQINEHIGADVARSAITRDIGKLRLLGFISKEGSGPNVVYSSAVTPKEIPIISKETTETKIKATRTGDAPPLVKFQITNPVTYLIRWWKKVIGNEGMEVRFKLKPLTAVLLTVVVIGMTTGGYGLAGIMWFVNKTPLRNTPIVKYLPQPSPTPNPWRETAFTGTLRSNDRGDAFLTTEEGEGITLILPDNVDLAPYVNRRILTIGLFNDGTNTLQIASADDMELLPYWVEPVPTTPPTPAPIITPEPVACTEDARICPDGSAVSRIPPACEFEICPDAEVIIPEL